MTTTHLSAQLRAIIASAKIQLLIVAKRPMNIATGIITPWMFLSLFLIPRIGNLNQDQITHAISATITASFWAASIWSGAGIIRREKWMGTLGHTLSGLLNPMAAIFAKMLGAVAYDVTLITISTTAFCLIFRIPFHPTHPFLLAAGIILVAVFGVCSSILIAGLLINSRNPFHLTNATCPQPSPGYPPSSTCIGSGNSSPPSPPPQTGAACSSAASSPPATCLGPGSAFATWSPGRK